MVILRPNQLPPATTPLGATDLVVVDQGAGGVNAADPQDVVDAAAPVPSQAEAEAGTDNSKRMTSLRTKQSIASQVGVTLASAAQGALASTAVQPTRQIIAGNGLTGGGALSADVTIDVGAGTGISVAANTVGLDATTQSRLLLGGGTTSQVLQKVSNTDYDVAWATVAAATAVSYAPQTLTSGEQLQARTNIGLSNVNNTSDANKPVSTATQTALDLKAPLASPTFTGTPSGPTAAGGTSTTQLATTAFVRGQASWTIRTPVTSGNNIDFSSIPSWVTEIEITYVNLSYTGAGVPLIQLGDAGGIEATGYLGSGADVLATAGATRTDGFAVGQGIAGTTVLNGAIRLKLHDATTNTWVATGILGTSQAAQIYLCGGSKSLSETLNSVRVGTTTSTAIDQGSIGLQFR